MKSPVLTLLFLLLVPLLCSAEPADPSAMNSALPSGSKVTVSSTTEEVTIDIKTPDSHYPFWVSLPTVRISYSTRLPTISLVASIGRPEEIRLVLRPMNVGRHFDAPPEQLALDADGIEVGRVALYTQEGAIDTHRARYIVKRDVLERLGSSFVLVSGSPFAQHIEVESKRLNKAGARVKTPGGIEASETRE